MQRARCMYKAGLRNFEHVASASVDDIVRALRSAPGASLEESLLGRHARRMQAEAKRKLKEILAGK